jgi:hypothetical protein
MSSNPVRERVAAVPGIVTGATLLALAALVVSCGRTDDDGDETGSRVVDGMIAYFGVVPSQVVGTHDPDHPEAAMHGGVPGGPRSHHVIVSLFEQDGSPRITDAELTATVTVSNRAGRGVTKPLQPSP